MENKQLENKFNEILIDEYQDTNNLQNIIFNAISKDSTNLFIVGDVKQSIYRFRNANPNIFNNDKDNAYKDKFPRLIALSKNFRSRSEVLDFCNFIFENTMTNSFGEVNYDEEEKLYLGALYPNTDNLETELIIIDNKKEKEIINDTDEENEEKEELSKLEKEAIVVADKIKELLDTKHQVLDKNTNKLRNIKPSDIAILLRSVKNNISDVYKTALNKRNISAYLEESSSYFDNYEVKFVINMLKVIDNPYDDVALMSFLTSDVIGISFDLIKKARKIKYISLYDSLVSFNNELINRYIDCIKKYRTLSYNMKISKLLTLMYNDLFIIPILSAYKGGINRQKNLEQMINHASNFESKKISNLHSFIEYLENIILNKGSLEGINPLSDKENVLITTIHKSKGLEYPVVIVSNAAKKFNLSDIKDDIMLSESLGFASNIHNRKKIVKYESLPISLFKIEEKNKLLSEELRVLYVALTRAREKLIITGVIDNLEKKLNKMSPIIGDDKVISSMCLDNVNSYLDIILACMLRYKDAKSLRNLCSYIPKTFETNAKIKTDIINASLIDESEFKEKEKIKQETFDINWFNEIINKERKFEVFPRYLSVSKLKKHDSFLRNPNFLTDGINHTNLGTLYHKIFEILPVKKYTVKLLEEELENILLSEEIKLVDINKIFAYLTSDLYDELLSADKVFKEYKIDFKIDSKYYDVNVKSGMILVSGIIDLMYIKGNTYTIVDYKTDKVTNMEELVNLYKKQLDLYEIAVKSKLHTKNVKKYIYSVTLNKYIML